MTAITPETVAADLGISKYLGDTVTVDGPDVDETYTPGSGEDDYSEEVQQDAEQHEHDADVAAVAAQVLTDKREAKRITEQDGLSIGQQVTHKRGGPVERGIVLRFSVKSPGLVTVYFIGSMSTRRVKISNLRALTA